MVLGTPYSCTSDLSYLETLKKGIEYHTLHFGNLNKSTITDFELKKMKKDYEIGKLKYDNSVCGKDKLRNSCIELQAKITSHKSSITYNQSIMNFAHATTIKKELDNLLEKFKASNCDAIINEFRNEKVLAVSDVYQQMDKDRIEAESKYQVKQKIFFGVIVLIGAVLVITTFGKKN